MLFKLSLIFINHLSSACSYMTVEKGVKVFCKQACWAILYTTGRNTIGFTSE